MKNFIMLSNFNQWANNKIYTACRILNEQEYKKNRKAFFSSIHGTLNHSLIIDIAYRSRIEGIAHGLKGMNQILFTSLELLSFERKKEDQRLINLIKNLKKNDLDKDITYEGFDSGITTYSISFILLTLFNHQTHHRGQVHNMLSQAGFKPPQIDIPDFKEETNYRF